MKKLFLAGIAALFLATGAAHAYDAAKDYRPQYDTRPWEAAEPPPERSWVPCKPYTKDCICSEKEGCFLCASEEECNAARAWPSEEENLACLEHLPPLAGDEPTKQQLAAYNRCLKRAERAEEELIRKIRTLENHGGCPIEECPPKLTPGGRAFAVAAKRQFGRGVAKKVGLFQASQGWIDCFSHPGKCVGRGCGGNWDPPEDQKDECDPRINPGRDAVAVLTITDARYLGLDKDYPNGSWLLCSYRTKPTIRFHNCQAWQLQCVPDTQENVNAKAPICE
jgi:hypothetical protein